MLIECTCFLYVERVECVEYVEYAKLKLGI